MEDAELLIQETVHEGKIINTMITKTQSADLGVRRIQFQCRDCRMNV